jgi:hypothetical protein
MINVAGTTDVLRRNCAETSCRSSCAARNSPTLRCNGKGPLRGPTLNLDIRQRGVFNGREWVGTPLGDASGFVGLIERNVR